MSESKAEAWCDLLLARTAEVEDALAQCREGPCRIACVGRTRVGKSTLRFALTGEGEDGIGRGGQRTTKEAIEYPWSGHVMVDTPGVGAYEGEDDVRVAMAAAHEADLVLWLVGSDGLQLATVTPIAQMLSRGVPVLAVVNHKETFDLADLDGVDDQQLFTETDARERRLREVLARDDVSVLHVQLDIARFARLAGNDRAWARSRMPSFERALAAAADAALAARPEVHARRITAALGKLGPVLDSVADDLEGQARALGERILGLEQRLADCRTLFETTLERGVDGATRKAEGALAAAAALACAQEHRGKAQDQFRTALTVLGDDLVADLSRTSDDAIRQAQLLLEDVTPSPNQEQEMLLFTKPAVQLGGDPLNARAVKTICTAADIGSTVLLITPIGWAMKALAFAVPRVVTATTPSVQDEQAERKQSVDNVCRQTEGHVEDLVTHGQERARRRFMSTIAEPLRRSRAAAARRKNVLSSAAFAARQLREDLP